MNPCESAVWIAPVLLIAKSVVVALAVDEPMLNSDVFVSPLFAWIANLPNGVVVPIPTLPLINIFPTPGSVL